MGISDYKIEHIIRFLIILIVFVNGSFSISNDKIRPFIILFLIFTLVSQLRINMKSNRMFILVTLFFDIGISYYINTHYGGFSYFLVYITLIDSLIFLDFESYLLSFFVSVYLMYFLKDKNIDTILLNVLVFFLVFVFAKHIKKLKSSLDKIEVLYDIHRNYSYELEIAKKRVEDFAKMIEKISQLEERNRISREIHDSAGHRLTGTLMQLEACLRLYEVNRQKSKELLQSVLDNLRQCTELLRQTVKGLSTKENINKIQAIHQMILNFQNTTGVKIRFNHIGEIFSLNPIVETVVYKNIQEALTNSVRHGKASEINIELKYSYEEIELNICDNGIGCGRIHKGMGISGMEERIKMFNGTMEIVSINGFSIKTVIPIKIKQVV